MMTMFNFHLRTSLLLLLHMGMTGRRRRSRRRFFREFSTNQGEICDLREGQGELFSQALLIVSSSTHCQWHPFSLKMIRLTFRTSLENPFLTVRVSGRKKSFLGFEGKRCIFKVWYIFTSSKCRKRVMCHHIPPGIWGQDISICVLKG